MADNKLSFEEAVKKLEEGSEALYPYGDADLRCETFGERTDLALAAEYDQNPWSRSFRCGGRNAAGRGK